MHTDKKNGDARESGQCVRVIALHRRQEAEYKSGNKITILILQQFFPCSLPRQL